MSLRDFLNAAQEDASKDKDTTFSIGELKRKWVLNAKVLYIGNAGPGRRGNLRKRLKDYIDFGQGKAVGKWGGRYIWQLADSDDLLICWRPMRDGIPRTTEKEIISFFEEAWGNLPFANIIH